MLEYISIDTSLETIETFKPFKHYNSNETRKYRVVKCAPPLVVVVEVNLWITLENAKRDLY